jgi:hypothetical protein
MKMAQRDTLEKLDKRFGKYKDGVKAREGLFQLLDKYPNEVGRLYEKIINGKINGGCGRASDECGCIYATVLNLNDVGVLFNVRKELGCELFSLTPLEKFAYPIRPGMEPKNNERIRLLLRAIDLWKANRDATPKDSPVIALS